MMGMSAYDGVNDIVSKKLYLSVPVQYSCTTLYGSATAVLVVVQLYSTP